MSNPIRVGHVGLDGAQSASRATQRWLVPVGHFADQRLKLDVRGGTSWPLQGRRILFAAGRAVLIFSIGVAAALAWQPYAGAARIAIANSSPQLSWLAPQPIPISIVQPHDETVVSDLKVVQERIDQIAAGQERVNQAVTQLTASQKRFAEEVGKIRAVGEYLLYQTSYQRTAAVPLPLRRPASMGVARRAAPRRSSVASR